MESIQGVAGQRATLPCNIQPREPNDAVSMVLWFKEDSGEPLYSYDARNRQFGKAKLWSASHFWGDRATFRASPPAQLTIRDLKESDQGVYRCRVDFRNSPTRNLKVNFTVIAYEYVYALPLEAGNYLAETISGCKDEAFTNGKKSKRSRASGLERLESNGHLRGAFRCPCELGDCSSNASIERCGEKNGR
ncbi:hypothetical protein WN48_11292 [Eufriesea mexicana]|uniref:Ig-like domain-containing protein n=1 Tax=Eufriesea mexicana TaxID=516756 RepID=A0A310SHI6_9HYME|nr:hypothetical protein WN48_11292 [Eufriesea mexicana]